MRVAIIPARGGSKRIARKNIKIFRGLPMIAWSIKAARESGCFDHVIVSTDDDEIAEISRLHGATVPFKRPRELADDHTPTIPVLAHAVEQFEILTSEKVKEACCVYATAPFLTPDSIRLGLETLLSDEDLDFAFSVTGFAFPIQRALSISKAGRVEMIAPEFELTRSQDLPERYHDAGQFYWFRRAGVFENDGVFSAKSAPVVLPRERVQDIDTPEDWRCAELAHELLERKSK